MIRKGARAVAMMKEKGGNPYEARLVTSSEFLLWYLGPRPNLSLGPTPIACHRDQRVSKGKGPGLSRP